MKKRVIHSLQNLVLLTATVSMLIAVAEWSVRALDLIDNVETLDKDGRPIYVPDEELGYALRPNATAVLRRHEFSINIRTNSHGYRDEEFVADPNAFVIVGMGDSFAWGHGVEQDESFFEVAERRLRKRHGNVRIHNLAVSGYAQLQHRNQVDFAKELGAKVLVVAFCIANDVLENGALIVRSVNDEGVRKNESRRPPLDAQDTKVRESLLHKHSHLWRFIVGRLSLLPRRLDLGSASWHIFDQFRKNPSPDTQEAFRITEQYLEEMVKACEELDIALVVMAIPMAYNVSDRLFDDELDFYSLDSDEFDTARIALFLEDFCTRHDVKFFDLAIRFRALSDSPEEFFYVYDAHLNKKGHAQAGVALAELLAPYVE